MQFFGDGKASIVASGTFLDNLWMFFSGIGRDSYQPRLDKGKSIVNMTLLSCCSRPRCVWEAPPEGSIKLNVNASLMEEDLCESIGIVARDHRGEIIMLSWDFHRFCSNGEEAELRACLVGLHIALALQKPIILEIDCLFVKNYLSNDALDKSAFVDLKKEALGIV
jgi:hypothetical protein